MDFLSPALGETGARVVIVALVLLLIAALSVLLFGLAQRVYSGRGFRLRGSRNRAPRLSVPDVLPVDSRRKLVLVRRDNVEHLLLVGGSTDLVIEATIPRSTQQPQRRPQGISARDATAQPAQRPPQPVPQSAPVRSQAQASSPQQRSPIQQPLQQPPQRPAAPPITAPDQPAVAPHTAGASSGTQGNGVQPQQPERPSTSTTALPATPPNRSKPPRPASIPPSAAGPGNGTNAGVQPVRSQGAPSQGERPPNRPQGIPTPRANPRAVTPPPTTVVGGTVGAAATDKDLVPDAPASLAPNQPPPGKSVQGSSNSKADSIADPASPAATQNGDNTPEAGETPRPSAGPSPAGQAQSPIVDATQESPRPAGSEPPDQQSQPRLKSTPERSEADGEASGPDEPTTPDDDNETEEERARRVSERETEMADLLGEIFGPDRKE